MKASNRSDYIFASMTSPPGPVRVLINMKFYLCVLLFFQEELAGEQSSFSGHSSYTEEMDTWIEIYFAPDYGVQDDGCFKVSPDEMTIAAGEWKEWKVSLKTLSHYELASSCNLVLRAQPKDRSGEVWYRPDPPAQIVGLKQAVREGLLKASCRDVRVELCALDLPYEDVMRVRKRFRLRNIGNGPQAVTASTQAPWTIVLNKEQRLLCGAGCVCIDEEPIEDERREEMVMLHLEPRSSIEICLEVRVDTKESWPVQVETAGPCQRPDYPQFKKTKTPLVFYDDDNMLLVSCFALCSWSAAPAEGCVLLRMGCGCSQELSWCRASVPCRASPSRDHKCRATRHDHTDDTNLLPPHLTF
ncbi:hypothetical protein K1T71_008067 [Dendrolimus kikuchii]|uniref:Uncharacterized protein n=1 Tax=Dendrolimus kikuchii TaxID=765133 RepID=A0ACC1CYY5_9NEOP|nr:hypothetical protein K1T71_008067 [Dendrolimus kikuchii]